jgi:hypothetical protein
VQQVQPGLVSSQQQERQLALQQRRLARERVRALGLLVLMAFILALAFLRFGNTIPWSAR